MDHEEELDKFERSASLVSCTIKLTREEGLAIKSLIQENYPHSFPHYSLKCGISTPNFYSTMIGERACSLDFLNKILSGIGYEAIVANPEIMIREVSQTEIITPMEEFIEEPKDHDTYE